MLKVLNNLIFFEELCSKMDLNDFINTNMAHLYQEDQPNITGIFLILYSDFHDSIYSYHIWIGCSFQ